MILALLGLTRTWNQQSMSKLYQGKYSQPFTRFKSELLAEISCIRMSQAVGLATLRSTEIIAQIVKSMEQNVEFIVTKTTFIDERTQRIESKVDVSIHQTQAIQSKQDEGLAQQKEMLAVVKNIDKIFEHERAGRENAQEKDHPGKKSSKTDPSEGKRVALNQVTSYFSEFSNAWMAISKETKLQRKEIHDDSVPATGMWLLK